MSNITQICRSRLSVPPSQFLRALSDDLRRALFEVEATSTFPPDGPLKTRVTQSISRMHEMHTCMSYYLNITESTQYVAQAAPSDPAASSLATPATGTAREATRSYRDAARQNMPPGTPLPMTLAQKQRIARAREIRKQTRAIKAQDQMRRTQLPAVPSDPEGCTPIVSSTRHQSGTKVENVGPEGLHRRHPG